MAEIHGISGSGSSTLSQDSGVTRWQEDTYGALETCHTLHAEYKQTADILFLNKAISLTGNAIPANLLYHPTRPAPPTALRKMLGRKFDLKQEAPAATHHLREARHYKLGHIFLMQFQRKGELGDLQRAIKYSEEALATASQDHFRPLTSVHINLGILFSWRFERIGDFRDLEKAIRHKEVSLAASPHDYPDRAVGHHDLGATLYKRFGWIGDLGDLQKAIENMEGALHFASLDHPHRATMQSNLARVLLGMFKLRGDFSDLLKAIEHGEAALVATPQDHRDRAGRNHSLGSGLAMKFIRTGALGDLQKSIKHTKEALTATSQYHPSRTCLHLSLGFLFSQRFERIGGLGDLHKSIKHYEEALAGTPESHPDRVYRHDILRALLCTRYERIGNLDDLHQAIKHCQEALETTPQVDPRRTTICINLATLFSMRFERIGNLVDLQEAIRHDEEALDAIPGYRPDRALICTALAGFVQSRYLNLRSAEDLNRSLCLYREAFHCRTSPKVRIAAAGRAASLLYSSGRFLESSSILEEAVNLMATINLRMLNQDDQQHILSELSGLHPAAASLALEAGRGPYHSLKLLELGRGIIMGYTIDSRCELSDLKNDYPLVFNQLHRLRTEIDSQRNGGGRATGGTSGQYRNGALARRREAVSKMEAILTRIRMLPGYEGFLLPPPQEDLMKIAAGGPIVVFNCTPYRSDAIIVTASSITSLRLPKLTHEETTHWMAQLASFGEEGRHSPTQDNKKMGELLVWLWDAAVGPVLDTLERSGTIIGKGVNDTNLKRIWWIGVGKLSMAPFHAAGDHSRGSTRNTISRVNSSYIPTIKALTYARQRRFQIFNEYGASFSPERSKKSKIRKRRKPRLLLVPMPETPGGESLPGVDDEVEYILGSSAKHSIRAKVLKNPTPAKVLKNVQQHEIVHFACHGGSGANPSDSHLVLLTPNGAGIDTLLARDISKVVSQNAQLAYLSSCSSAQNSSTVLADEVIHLASAFQLAGFSHTLATLWEACDIACSEVARDFYDLLFQYHENGDGHRHVSVAFHQAVKKLRAENPSDFLAWAPFIHMGA